DYVHVKLDWRMPHAQELKKSLGPNFRGVPWMVILSESGKTLATSQSPQGNIAFPRSAAKKEHFRNMLQSTSRRLSKSDIDALIAALPE
ncbi:MAG: thioredoxin family protein, partial [Pirellulales bacterium]|nr:thioredoxin family protein [Pirellulales bacterium]